MDTINRVLKDNIGKLQLRLHDYPDEVSPTKKKSKSKESMETGRSQLQAENDKRTSKWQFSILRSFLYITCSLLFPTIIYSIQGYCPLFWHVTAVSTCFTCFILLMVFSFYSYKVQMVMSYFYKVFFGAQNKVKIVIQNADYLGSTRKYGYISATLLLFIIFAFGYWAVETDMPNLFNLCLFTSGFVCGILSVSMYKFLKEPKQLPYLSPMISKKKETVLSPSSRRGLNFSNMGPRCSATHSPVKYFRTSPEKSSTVTEYTDVATYPVSLMVSEQQKAVSRNQRHAHDQ